MNTLSKTALFALGLGAVDAREIRPLFQDEAQKKEWND